MACLMYILKDDEILASVCEVEEDCKFKSQEYDEFWTPKTIKGLFGLRERGGAKGIEVDQSWP